MHESSLRLQVPQRHTYTHLMQTCCWSVLIQIVQRKKNVTNAIMHVLATKMKHCKWETRCNLMKVIFYLIQKLKIMTPSILVLFLDALARPDICPKLYSWRKICHVEKFQLSMYINCGEIENFSTCGEISDVSTWQMWRNLKFSTYGMCVM